MFVYIVYVYSTAVLLIIGCVLAIEVRQASAIFNDASSIALSIYTFSITVIIITCIQFALNSASSYVMLYVIRSVGVIVAISSSLIILLGSRIYAAIDDHLNR